MATEVNPAKFPYPFAGLQAGRIVNYVLRDGGIRPMIVVVAWLNQPNPLTDPTGLMTATGCVNGIVFRDGGNDAGQFGLEPAPLEFEIPAAVLADKEGDAVSRPTKVSIPSGVRLAEWATSVAFDPDMKPGTWHWPVKVAESRPTIDLMLISLRIDEIVERLKHHGIEMPGPFESVSEAAERAAQGSGSERWGKSRPDEDPVDENRPGATGPIIRGSDVFSQPPVGHGEPAKHPNAPEKPKTATEGNKADSTSA